MNPTDGITNDQIASLGSLILTVTALLGVVLTYVSNRATASPAAIKALAETVETLRRELNAEKDARREQAEKYEKALLIEVDKRKALERRFEKERIRYQTYIKLLLGIIQKAGIHDVPEWDVLEEE